MSSRLPQELLQELRTYVEHFDETGHLGESSTVAEIKRRLNQRIVEVEAQLRSMQSSGRESDRVAPDRWAVKQWIGQIIAYFCTAKVALLACL